MEENIKQLELRVTGLEKSNSELSNRGDLLGRQITQMKELYEKVVTEVNILKEGGNL